MSDEDKKNFKTEVANDGFKDFTQNINDDLSGDKNT